ncbi:hypothetical protein RRG08_056011 [Elysia crispata]|uniref:Uncharacterized protein n=1 Tax=Elysia crispata TaxID=231223 RepID=A0AAE1DYS6_9GAST|nr:hypothetical protein RRG08_056011 [Elysia crispata]
MRVVDDDIKPETRPLDIHSAAAYHNFNNLRSEEEASLIKGSKNVKRMRGREVQRKEGGVKEPRTHPEVWNKALRYHSQGHQAGQVDAKRMIFSQS